MPRRTDIEGLRAVAVLVVVGYHCGFSWLSGGYVGVDVFFVLSGFLITGLMLHELETTSTLSFSGFYGRRARRLLPAACMGIVATVIAGWWILSPLERERLVDDAVSASTYTMNWRLVAESTDYLQADRSPSALQHYWSLAVEEQFYILWPVLVWLLAGRRVLRWRLAAGLGLLVVLSFAIAVQQTTTRQPLAFFGLHARLWQLGAGSLLAVTWGSVGRLPRRARDVLGVAGLVGIGVAVVLFDDSTTWPGFAALLPTLATLAVIAGGPHSLVTGPLSQRPLQWIGARSYSWYLWHWPALILTAAVAGSTLVPVAAVAVAAAALAVAHVGYTLVEQPIRHHRALVPSGRRSIAVGLGLTAVCLAGLVVVRPLSDDVSLSGQAAAAMAAPLDLAELAELLERSAAIEAVPPNLRPTLQAAALAGPDEYVAGCNLGYRSSELLECELGDVGGLTSVVLIGDSHAAHWIPALDIAAREAGIRLISHTKSACPVSTNTVFVRRLGRPYTECDEWRERVFQRVNQIRPDGVIVVQASGLDNDHLEADYQRGWVTSIERLQTSGADVIVLSDTPYPLVHPPECLAASPSHASGCAMTRSDGVSNQMSAPEQAAAATGASFVRTESLLCGPEHCPVIVGDLLVYRDTSHLTTLYSAWLAGPLAQLLGSPWS